MNVYRFSFLLILSVLFFSCSKKALTSLSNSTTTPFNEAFHIQEIADFQDTLNAKYLGDKESPLSVKQKEIFKANNGHDFFDRNSKYRIEADFNTKNIEKDIQFETTTDRIAVYDVYGVATFKLDGKSHSIKVFQSHRLRKMDEYKDHLFLPFTDLTNGNESYGGGRYIDLKIPSGDKIIIDFNKAYNPYCAYSSKYSCPIPPLDNHIQHAIKAGIKYSVKE